MKFLLLGATGRTGQCFIDEAINRQYEVNCLVRNPEKVRSHELVNAVQGDVTQPEQIAPLLEGCDGIINVLNVSRKSDFPWSSLRAPSDLLSTVTADLLPVMEDKRVKRVVVCSAWGVGDSRSDIPGWFRWFIDNSNIGIAYVDHEKQEELLRASEVDWTIVRPVGLTNSKKTEEIRTSYGNEPKPSFTISRRSVAQYMLDALSDTSLIHKTVTISKV